MEKGTENKGRDLSHYFRLFVSDDQFEVDVSVEKQMNRFIPLAIELFISV